MKQQNLKEIRNYQQSPRSYHEIPDPNYRSDLDFDGEISLTKQSEADACDINNIMKRYEATGLLPNNDGRQPSYGDFSSMETFQEAMHIVSSAQSAFMGLPAELRAKFQNDPAQFLGYIEKGATDPKIAKELVDLGLAEMSPDERVKTQPAPDSAASKKE